MASSGENATTASSFSCTLLTTKEIKSSGGSGAIAAAIIPNVVQLLAALVVVGCLNYSKHSKKAFMPGRPQASERPLLESVREAATVNIAECMPIDGQVVIRLCQLGFKFFLACTVTSFALMPVYAQGNGNQHGFLQLSTSNVTENDSWMMHVTTACAYFQVAAFFFLMHDEWSHLVKIRHRHFKSVASGREGASAAQAQYSLMVERVPKGAQNAEDLQAFFNELFDGIHSCVLQRDTTELYHARELESATTSICCCCKKTLQTGVHSIVRLEQGVTRTARNTVQAVGTIAEGGTTGLRGVADTGVNLIHNIGQNIVSVARWEDGSSDEDRLRPASTAFVTLRRVRDRLTAEQVILLSADNEEEKMKGTFKDWIIRPAPEASDIVWQNAAITATEVKYRTLGGVILCFVGVAFWAVPVGSLQAAVSTDNLKQWAPETLAYMEAHLSKLYDLLFGYLPVLALMGLILLLPCMLNEFATRFEARKVKSEIVRVVLWRNLLFQLATLWTSVFSGTISTSIWGILDRPACTYIILGRSIPRVSLYFTNFVIARLGTSLPLLLLPIPSFLVLFRVSKPEPQHCYFETEAVNIAIVFVIGLTYSLVAPAILPICMCYFGLATLVYRWKFLNVYTPEFNCGGAFWNELFTGLMIGLFLGLLSLVGLAAIYAGANSVEFWAIALLPMFAVAFTVYCNFRLAPLAKTMPYMDAVQVDRECAAVVTETFVNDYYKDPILKPAPVPSAVDVDEDDEDSSGSSSSSEEDDEVSVSSERRARV